MSDEVKTVASESSLPAGPGCSSSRHFWTLLCLCDLHGASMVGTGLLHPLLLHHPLYTTHCVQRHAKLKMILFQNDSVWPRGHETCPLRAEVLSELKEAQAC